MEGGGHKTAKGRKIWKEWVTEIWNSSICKNLEVIMFSSQKAVTRTWEVGKIKFHVPRQMGSFQSVCSNWMPQQPLHAAQLFCGRMLRKLVPACRKCMLLPGILIAWVITVSSPDRTPSKALPIGLAVPSNPFVAGNGTNAAKEAQWCAPGRANPCQVVLKKIPKPKEMS